MLSEKEILIGMYCPDGGSSGEFAIRWKKVGSYYAARLEVFQDAWSALWLFADLLERLPHFDSERPETSHVITLLKQLGITDRTHQRAEGPQDVPSVP